MNSARSNGGAAVTVAVRHCRPKMTWLFRPSRLRTGTSPPRALGEIVPLDILLPQIVSHFIVGPFIFASFLFSFFIARALLEMILLSPRHCPCLPAPLTVVHLFLESASSFRSGRFIGASSFDAPNNTHFPPSWRRSNVVCGAVELSSVSGSCSALHGVLMVFAGERNVLNWSGPRGQRTFVF